jgi:hypothetical protein
MLADSLYHAVVNLQLLEAGRLSESITDIEALMPKKSKILPPDHPAYTEVIEAMRRYRDSQDTGTPAIEVERLRLIAESQLHGRWCALRMSAFDRFC